MFRPYMWAIFRLRFNLQISYTSVGCLGGWRGRDLFVSIVGTVTSGCYKWIFSSCLCTHVKWVTILMLRIIIEVTLIVTVGTL